HNPASQRDCLLPDSQSTLPGRTKAPGPKPLVLLLEYVSSLPTTTITCHAVQHTGHLKACLRIWGIFWAVHLFHEELHVYHTSPMSAAPQESRAPWLLLIFSLPAKRASERVQVWRKLKRHGALPLRSSGYVLPNNATNQERFEWLAAAIRKYKGEASVVQVYAIDDLPSEALVQRFVETRSRDYEALLRELQKVRPTSAGASSHVARLRNRFQEIAEI